MNVRLAPQEVRFRITRDEFETLKTGRAQVLKVVLPGRHAFQASVCADTLGAWHLDSDPTGLWLTVPRSELALFESGVPTTEALTHRFELADGGYVELNLEVDVQS